MRKDLKGVRVDEEEWYEKARRSRAGRWAMCRLKMEEMTKAQQSNRQAAAMSDVECEVYERKFKREQQEETQTYEGEKEASESAERSNSL